MTNKPYDEINANIYDFINVKNTIKVMSNLDAAINYLGTTYHSDKNILLKNKETDRYILELEANYIKIIDELKRMQEKLIKFKNERSMNEVME